MKHGRHLVRRRAPGVTPRREQVATSDQDRGRSGESESVRREDTAIDGDLLHALHELASPLLDRVMLVVSDLGGWNALAPLA